ncbi:MAG: hypothetical protein J6A97_03370 [Clostridia bacterium]|nr:hypothetical protein [Clostridia bacterium]
MNQNDIDALLSAAKSGNKKQMSDTGNAVAANLSDAQKRTVEKAMSDPEYLKQLLSSQKAQEIIKKLKGEGL